MPDLSIATEQAATAMEDLAAERGEEDGNGDLAAAARLAQRKRLGPFRPKEARADLRQRDMAALARAGFSYDVARQIVDAANTGELEEMIRSL